MIQHKVILNIYNESDEIEFTIEDEGCGFDHLVVPDPTLPQNLEKLNGRGIYLMNHLADCVEFLNNGNKVKLTFSLTGF